MEKQICTYCVMDNEGDSSIVFDEEGQCNYCKDALRRLPKEYFPNQEGKRRLNALMEEIKTNTKNDPYNCMVGVSGGLDSSYLLYLGYQYNLKMLAVHIDDGLDSEIATDNIKKLCEKTGSRLITICPKEDEYADLILAFLKAGVSNLAMPQDNILFRALDDVAKENNIKYSLSGVNFAMESILARFEEGNACDKKHILKIHEQFGEKEIIELQFQSLWRRYVGNKYFSKVDIVKPLNYIDYNFKTVLEKLHEFCDYVYYDGKHYESILTRFLQCYYLPVKYGIDKRKSHFSSLIVSGQMTRKEAIEQLKSNPYIDTGLYEQDKRRLAEFLHITEDEFIFLCNQPPKKHAEYKMSFLNRLAPIARKFRKFLQ